MIPRFEVGKLVWGMLILFAVIFFGWIAVDFFFIDNVIKSDHPIEPELKLKVKKNQVDTVYIYREP